MQGADSVHWHEGVNMAESILKHTSDVAWWKHMLTVLLRNSYYIKDIYTKQKKQECTIRSVPVRENISALMLEINAVYF